MNPNIEAIFLDVGNTLRIVLNDPEFSQKAAENLHAAVGAKQPLDEFISMLKDRYKVYRKRAKTILLDVRETELWSKWMLPDYPEGLIVPQASKLTRYWRDTNGRRVAREGVKETIIELHRRGYKLGLIANTITETEIPDWMEEDGIREYFSTVILSSVVALRKPNPEIYLMAAREIGVDPAKCAYLGDNPLRDIQGTREAGYGMMILIEEPDTLRKMPEDVVINPDRIITRIDELLDIFPPRNQDA